MKKRILIAGGTGLVGTRLIQLLDRSKYDISILSRRSGKVEDIQYFKWDFESATIDHEAVNCDIIINLTGAGIADKRWSAARKKVLIDSRVDSARLIQSALQATGYRPQVYLSSSAIGYYGNRGDEELYETSEAGLGFMAECCKAWEASATRINDLCERLLINRVGIVLSTRGGALTKILMTKSLGVYNYFGDGKQFYSWIHIDDLCNIFIKQIEEDYPGGIYNAVSPLPITNRSFTVRIKDALNGKLVLPAPAFGLRAVLGEMADVVLNSNRVYPKKLNEMGFRFEYDQLEDAVCDLIARKV